jgi:hypothetical protein
MQRYHADMVQRESISGLIWCIVAFQLLLAAVLLVVGTASWSNWHG